VFDFLKFIFISPMRQESLFHLELLNRADTQGLQQLKEIINASPHDVVCECELVIVYDQCVV
jgi:hypothetical protein